MSCKGPERGLFRRVVWAHYQKHGRHELPWRKTADPYKILVSEVMLQQTQVDRVIPFYTSFVRKFPTAKKLAAAPLAEVLRAWQGLGYNRRAKMLHAAAKEITAQGVPKSAEGLRKLPGVGPYTACAVAAFALNEDGIVIETNIRTAVIQNFFKDQERVTDTEIAGVLEAVLPKGRAREWYSALMDYGAHLKRSGVRVNARTEGYMKQAKFAGSAREARGAVLRALSEKPLSRSSLIARFGPDERRLDQALTDLLQEGLIQKKRTHYTLPD